MGVGQKEVLMNAAENVGQLDLNNMQRFLRAFTADWMLGNAGGFQGDSVGASGFDRMKAAYCLGDSGAPFPTGVARQISHLGGPIMQWKTGPTFPLWLNAPPANWGLDPYCLVYWLSPDELITTHAVGDPTNPRWDLVTVKLNDVSNDAADNETRQQKQVVGNAFVISSGTFVKRRKVTVTKNLIQGTPAGSPTMPALPAGEMPLYAIRVPANHNAVFTVDNDFHDYRMPLGSFAVDILAAEAFTGSQLAGTGHTLITGALSAVEIAAANGTLYFSPRGIVGLHSCRLVGLSTLGGVATTNFNVNVARFNPLAAGTYNQMGGNATWLMTSLGTSASDPSGSTHYKWYKQALAGGAGNNPPSEAAKPPWGTGWPSGYASRPERSSNEDTADFLGVRVIAIGATASRISRVRFHFAGMPG